MLAAIVRSSIKLVTIVTTCASLLIQWIEFLFFVTESPFNLRVRVTSLS